MKQDILDSIKNIFRLDDNPQDDFDEEDDVDETEYEETKEPAEKLNDKSASEGKESEVAPNPSKKSVTRKPKGNTSRESRSRAKIIGVQPTCIDDRSKIAEYVKQNLIVVIDYTKISDEDMNRINDYLCGVVFSLDSKFVIVTDKIYFITPPDIAIAGKFYK